MISRWANLKPKAVALRREGNSIGSIENMLGIPRSTLSGWFRSVSLTKRQQVKLKKQSDQGLVKARVAAVRWHNAQKKIPQDEVTLELALAFLYLGEGGKTRNGTSLGSSDVHIAKFFMFCLQKIYHVPVENIKCYLHLRADQDIKKMERYWSRELQLPLTNFGKASVDKRTEGRLTYPHYKGVCLMQCGRVDIQRRLMYIANGFCDRIS